MRLPDVNVLLYAFNSAASDHQRYRAWLDDALSGDEPVALFDGVLAAVVRLSTHPRLLDPPATIERAFAFTDALRAAPSSVPVSPGPRHWQIFERIARDGTARGNLVTDAYLAALALESGSELITTDRDFARFPGLRWRHPFN
jgi:toxin-antitoxin system PIN domain toxin